MAQKRTLRKAKYILHKQTDFNAPEHIWTFIGAFLGIGLLGYLQSLRFSAVDNTFLIGSFGASAVLIYGATNSPLSQPRNVIGGHVLSALIGVCIAKVIPDTDLNWLACALAVSLSIVVMQITKTMHPPGGATALIANIGSSQIKALGFWYIVNPVLIGILLLLITALITNTWAKNKAYRTKNR
ncbi:HPP family protein [Formosa sp. A9]|uniref:HPP family protein n=1 Tax=Formosa sp. A9 TaxID=3442641 RepID=UPI003EBB8E71